MRFHFHLKKEVFGGTLLEIFTFTRMYFHLYSRFAFKTQKVENDRKLYFVLTAGPDVLWQRFSKPCEEICYFVRFCCPQLRNR